MKTQLSAALVLVVVGVAVITTSGASSVTQIIPRNGGLGGGVRLTIKGSGFSLDQYNVGEGNEDKGNKVTLVNTGDSQDAVECDIHKDGCTEEQIMCYTRAGMTVNVNYKAKVKVDGENVPECTRHSCLFTGKDDYTPKFDSITPQSGKPGEIILTLHGKIFTTGFGSNTGASTNGVSEKILRMFAPQTCNLFSSTDVFYQLELDSPDSQFGTIQCKPEGSFVGVANPSMTIESPYGRSLPKNTLFKISGTGIAHLVQYYTDIQAISPAQGSTEGGTKLTISGDYYETSAKASGMTSTYSTAEAYVDDQVCKIEHVERDREIICTTPPQSDTPRSFHCGGRGVRVESWDIDFSSYDDAFAMTDTPDDVVWFDETRYCITNKLTRMKGVFHVAFDGNYQIQIKGKAKLVVEIDGTETGIESTGDWAGTGIIPFEKGDMIKLVAVGKPRDNSDSCVVVRAIHRDTTFTPKDTGMAYSELQSIKFTSTVEYQNYTLKFRDFAAGTAVQEKQKLCVTGSSNKFQLGLFGVYTVPIASLFDVVEVKKAMDLLPVPTGDGGFTVEPDNANEACVNVIFPPGTGDGPMITTKPTTGVDVSEVVQGLSDNMHFAFNFNDVSSPILTYDSTDPDTFANKIQDTLEVMFSVRCPAMYSDGGAFHESFEDGPSKFGSKTTAEVEAFCGRYSCKNCYRLFPMSERDETVMSVLYTWLCFAVRGHDNDFIFLKFKDRDDNYKQTWVTMSNIYADGDWAYKCVDVKAESLRRWPTSQLNNLVESRIFNYQGDYYVDEVHFATTKTIESLDDIADMRLPPASPNPNTRATMKWVSVEYDDTDSQYLVSLAPYDCLFDFDLLTMAGSDINGDYSASSSRVSSSLKTNTNPAGTMEVTVTNKASKPIQGTIRVSFMDNQSDDIDVQKEDVDFKDMLEGIEGIGTLSVHRTGAPPTCDNFEMYVEFVDSPGDKDKMTATADFTSNNNPAVEIIEKRNGHLSIEPIPGDMVCTLHTTPQVRVVINDIPTQCVMENNECAYTYSSASTPTVIELDITEGNQDDVLTIKGTLFDETNDQNTVTIGGVPCEVTFSNTTHITCTVGNGPLATFPVDVTVAGKGKASGTAEFTYTAALSGISPSEGTVGGNNVLTVSGTGLSEDSVVTVGTETCVKTGAEIPTKYFCAVPEYSDLTVTSEVTVSVSVQIGTVVLSATFDYKYTVPSAQIDEVITGDLSAHGNQSIRILGINMGDDGKVFIDNTELIVTSRSDTEIIAITPIPTPPGKGKKLLVFYQTDGAILQSSAIPKVNIPLEVTKLYPNQGSNFGGTPLTITGIGFGESKADVKVMIGEHLCEVKELSNAEIKCTLADTAQTHEVDNHGDHGLKSPFAFNPKTLTVKQGDFVRWSWSTPEFVAGTHAVIETESLDSTEDKPGGISSGARSREGSFIERMSRLGSTFFWSGYVDPNDIYYRMTVKVIEREETKEPLRVFVATLESTYDLESDQSNPTDSSGCSLASSSISGCDPETIVDPDPKSFFLQFTKCRSPVVDSINFDSKDPTVARSALTTTVLTYRGSGFGSEDCANVAKIGDCVCTVSDSSTSAFNCTLDADCEYPVGIYQLLTLMVNQYGNALNNIQDRLAQSLALLPLIEGVSPTSGSSQGGTVIYVTGTGFSDDLESVVVTLDDIRATCSNSLKNSVTCTTPKKAVAGSAVVKVKIGGIPAVCQSDCSFQYDASITPKITSVSPQSVNSTTTLIIKGELLGTDSDKLSIKVGGETCNNIVIISNDAEISCSIDAIPAGENDIELILEDVGEGSSNPDVKVNGADVASVEPPNGSVHGQNLLTFNGHGFVEGLSIQVDGEDICETITVKSLMQVECVTLAHNEMTTAIIITSNRVTYDGVNYEFTEAASPHVTNVNPSSGAVGDTVTVTGERFGTVAEEIKVFFGSVECTDVGIAGSDIITCITGSQSSGAYDVIVVVSGKGQSQPDVPFTYTITLTSFEPLIGDTFGNQLLELIGNGFNESQQVTVCDNECKFYSLPSPSSYKCITPPGTGLCSVKITEGQLIVTAAASYTYQLAVSPNIATIIPSRGGTGGNTEITITGDRFSNTKSEVSVTIDGVPCAVSFSSTTEIICHTGRHEGSKLSDLNVVVGGLRASAADLSTLLYHYVDVWSSPYTWGGNDPPGLDEYVVIPKDQVILLDTDTGVLEMLLIQGQLIFDEVDVILRSRRILITDGGKLQIGSPEKDFPPDKTAVIELHGHQRNKELPIYGTKVLGVREGNLDLYGAKVDNTWTMLASTAAAGATDITVQDSLNGWKVGDQIFIASTGPKDSTNENEKRTITAISGTEITLDEALQFEHLGNTETYTGPLGNDVNLELRAEVGLVSRNVIVRGNPDDQWADAIEACDAGFNSGEFVTQTCFEGRFGEEKGSSAFGATIMIHQTVKDTQVAQAHLSYVEVTFAGQAFRLGRYPIHFHLNGNMSQSFVRGCAIHETFNRAVNIHGSHNTLIEKNVAYNVMGGAFFLEDGIETGNTYQDNLGVFVKSSTSLLNDDITPAVFWITNADNIFKGNHAAGGTHFGFWYRMHEHPDGPSFTDKICPRKVPIKKFQHNSAHSFGWFGLWMFAEYYPAEGGLCESTVAAPAVIEDFISWNNQKGIEFVDFGSMQILRGIFAQNQLAGFEGKRTFNTPIRDYLLSPTVNDTLFVGQATLEKNRNSKGGTKAGFIWPFGYALRAHNIKFLNFGSSGVAFKKTSIDGTCSDKCGGYSNQVSGLQFENTPVRIRHRWEHEGVVEDLDGSLCGSDGPKKILPYMDTLPPECTKTCSDYDFPEGIESAVCPFDKRFHRLSFNNPSPSSVAGKKFKVQSSNGFSEIPFMTHRLTHTDGWSGTLEDGETYVFSFENSEELTNVSFTGTFEDFKVDDCIVFKWKMTERPDEVTTDGGITKLIVSPEQITCSTENLITGNWSFADGFASVAIVGQSTSGTDPSTHHVHFRALKCLFPLCEKPEDPETEKPPTGRPNPFQLWEDPIWELDADNVSMTAIKYDGSGIGPPTGYRNITIEIGLWVLIKKSSYRKLKIDTLLIKGGLEVDFEEDLDFELKANFIIILGGRLHVGWKENRMLGTVNIILTGSQTSRLNTDLHGYELGNKAIGVFGGLELHGRDVGSPWVLLYSTVSPGDKVLRVENGSQISKWKQNDKIIITSTSNDPEETEEGIIDEVDSETGTITLKKKLKSRHTGGIETVDGRAIEVRAAIGLLSRSITIDGGAVGDTAYGGRVLVSVTLAGTELRTGYARLSDVSFTHMGQDGFTDLHDPRFALVFLDTGRITDVKPSEVHNCAFDDLYNTGIGVIGLADMVLKNNVVHKPLGNGMVTTSDNTRVEGNLVSRVQFTGTYNGRFEEENFRFESGIEAIKSNDLHLIDNYVTGSERIGFHVPGENCDSDTSRYTNNIAASNQQGVTILPYDDLTSAGITTCTKLCGFTMFKNIDYGMYYSNVKSFQACKNNYIDENVALFPMVNEPDPLEHTCGGKSVAVRDSNVVGTSSLSDCAAETEPSGNYFRHNEKNLRSKRGPNSERIGLLFAGFFGNTNNCGEKPCWTHMSYNANCGKMTITGVTFQSFNGEQSGCSAALAISTMKGNDDFAHPVRASGNKVFDVDEQYKIGYHRPNVEKINPADCVDMDCDAMKKAMFKDLDGSFMGEIGTAIPESEWEWGGDPRRGLNDRRVPKDALTDLEGNVMTVDELTNNGGRGIVRTEACEKRSVSQGRSAIYWCPALQHEMLLIESLDEDTELRRLSPVAIISDGYVDLINGPQDHGWCNGYTCQKRISTFFAIVMTRETTERYANVYFSSTQPDKIRYALLDAEDRCVVVGQYYLNPHRIDVFVDGSYVLPNTADKEKWTSSRKFVLNRDAGANVMPTCDDPNGSNHIDPDKRIIYFTVRGGTDISNAITLERADVVIVAMGFPALSEDDFFNDDTIIHNLANFLGISPNKVRIVDIIAAGSTRKRRSTDSGVTVVFEVGEQPEDEEDEPVTEFASNLMDSCQDGSMSSNLGVEGTSCEEIIVEESVYSPVQPDELWFYDSVTSKHEGVPFLIQPKIRAYDTNGDIVANLGIDESPWEITASLRTCDSACGHPSAELTGTLTVSSSQGWFNFTDLQISHKGENYRIDFEVTSPSGTNLTLETAAFSVDGLPMTAGIYSMTSNNIVQDRTFSMTMDLRDSSTNTPIPDITWRDHTSFDMTCDVVTQHGTGNLTGTLSTTYDMGTGKAAYDDMSFSGYGMIYISCLVVSTPAEYEFYSVHKVFILGTQQENIALEASNRAAVRYNLDYKTTLPTEVAEAQLHQATLEVFIVKWPMVVIRESSITEGSIIVSFTIEGETSNVTAATEEMCQDLSSGLKVTVGSSTLTLDGYMTVDGEDYFSTCGRKDDSDGLHPAFIALIVILCLLVIGIIVFLLVWRLKIRPKSKTHGVNGDDSNRTVMYPGGFYYLDNGKMVFLAAPNQKIKGASSVGIQAAVSKPPVTTLYHETRGAFAIRRSPLPQSLDTESGGLTPAGL